MRKEDGYFYRFGDDFWLDPSENILYYSKTAVPLKLKAVEILIVLVENAGSVVGKKDLMDAVWQETFVQENNLSVNIYELRKAFQKIDETAKYIETVPRRGFRFGPPVEKIFAAEKPALQNKTHGSITNKSLREIGDRHLQTQTTPQRETAISSEATFNQSPRIFANRNAATQLQFRRNFFTAFVILCVVMIGGGFLYAWRSGTVETIKSQADAPAGQQIRGEEKERGTSSIEAYQFYLRGRELWQTRSNSKMEKGIEFFRRAIELYPDFAAPYLGIADSLSMMRNDAEDWRQAEEYARKAISIDPASADAHASLAFIMAMDKWQWSEAEKEFKYALALDETSGKSHQWYATLLAIERRYDEAETHLKRAIEIDPLSPNYNADLCDMYYFANRYDDAFAQCRKAYEINPDFAYASALRNIYITEKRYDEAAQEVIENHLRMGGTDSQARDAAWYKAYKKDGFRGWMRAEINMGEKRSDVLLVQYDMSIYYALLGEREKTLALLEKCFAGHAFLLPFANARPEFDFLRDDPHFQDLMHRVGLNQN